MAFNQGYSYRLVLGSEAQGQGTLAFLARQFDHSSADQWRSRLESGEILIDSVPAHGGEQLRAGSVLVWNRPPWDEEDVPLEYRVIYEDAQLLVVDKPSGLPTLPGAGFYLHTLLSQVQKHYPEAHSLHRLGRATSGLVLFARDRQTARTLSRNWTQVHKQYQALASGVASRDSYDIQVPIGPVSHPRLGEVHAASPTGKPAHSIARVIERRADSTLLEVDLLTGRPHQIRIHLASIGYPLLGDPLYASGGRPIADTPGLPGDAGYHLHAKRMELIHPLTCNVLSFQAPIPQLLLPIAYM
jgi:23S rRNA pseudouridine1911/1915/1917 synthase